MDEECFPIFSDCDWFEPRDFMVSEGGWILNINGMDFTLEVYRSEKKEQNLYYILSANEWVCEFSIRKSDDWYDAPISRYDEHDVAMIMQLGKYEIVDSDFRSFRVQRIEETDAMIRDFIMLRFLTPPWVWDATADVPGC
jgi:hypothetical protein